MVWMLFQERRRPTSGDERGEALEDVAGAARTSEGAFTLEHKFALRLLCNDQCKNHLSTSYASSGYQRNTMLSVEQVLAVDTVSVLLKGVLALAESAHVQAEP